MSSVAQQSITRSVGRGVVNVNRNDVLLVQRLLNLHRWGSPFRTIAESGVVTEETITAIEEFQRRVLKMPRPDGRVDPGGRTLSELSRGNVLRTTPPAGEIDTNPEGWPAKPGFDAISDIQRAALFGTFKYESAPHPNDQDAIKILGTWARDNIITVKIPQLAAIEKPQRTNQQFHNKAAKQFIGLWQAWEDAGLLDRIVTYSGSFVPRFQRRTARIANVSPLSNHAWGTAFDINREWNDLNKTPAIIGKKGCVFELVRHAHEHGFFWGGHFSRRRVDGMHFEVAKLV